MALLLVTTLSAFSQTKNITVSGRVVEDTKEPAIQATVQLLLLPDSVQASGTATTAQGYFTLPKVSAGKYVLKVSYIGFKSQYIPLHLYATTTAKNVGTLTLETDAVMLAEAVVTAEAPQVQVVEDTLVYTSSAYRTPEGAMLEELVKKLPGAEIDDEGNVKINGKDLSKIMVDGKEFFGGDVKTGLKNLPVDMIEKLKTYDKKSDLARIGQKAMELAREEGIKVGMLRPITLWPFPTKAIAEYANKVKGMLVTELNAGQMVEDVRLAVNGRVKVEHFGRLGGIVPDPDEIVTALKEQLIK